MRDRVTAVGDVIVLAFQSLVDEVGKLEVSETAKAEHQRLMQALVQDMVVVPSGNQRHCGTEQISGGRHTRLLVHRTKLANWLRVD